MDDYTIRKEFQSNGRRKPIASPPADGGLSDLAKMMQAMLEDRRAREAEIREAKSYGTVKTAIIRRYNINDETYRRQFRAAKLRKEETPQTCYPSAGSRAQEGKGLQDDTKVFDLLVKEQLLNCLPEDARVWVRERKPKTSVEEGELAEDYMQVREA